MKKFLLLRRLLLVSSLVCHGCMTTTYVSAIGMHRERAYIVTPVDDQPVHITVTNYVLSPGGTVSPRQWEGPPYERLIPYLHNTEQANGKTSSNAWFSWSELKQDKDGAHIPLHFRWQTKTFDIRYETSNKADCNSCREVILEKTSRHLYGYPAQALIALSFPVDLMVNTIFIGRILAN